MTFSCEFRVLTLVLAVTMPLFASAQGPQISEGVRAMARVGTAGIDPHKNPYWINRQPPIYPYMSEGETRSFKSGAELVAFFRSFPPDVQKRGLWITRAGVTELENEDDRNHLARLVQEARGRKVLMYICAPGEHPSDSPLAAWNCVERSPDDRSQVIRCLPRIEPHQGHPWWDCKQLGEERTS